MERERGVQSRWKGYSGLKRGRKVVFQGSFGKLANKTIFEEIPEREEGN